MEKILKKKKTHERKAVKIAIVTFGDTSPLEGKPVCCMRGVRME